MAGQDLVDSIKQRIAEGESKESIRQFYLSKGWQGDDVDVAFESIDQSASKSSGVSTTVQLPFTSVWRSWDAKTAHLPNWVVVIICGLIALLVLGLALTIYNVLDPLGSRQRGHDVARELEFSQVQEALERYYGVYGLYPAELTGLVPDFLLRIPVNSSAESLMKYSLVEDGVNYEMCANLEKRGYTCFRSSLVVDVPTAIPAVLQISVVPSLKVSGLSIVGSVFVGSNENGLFDGREKPLVGSLTVVDSLGDEVCVLKTDSKGGFDCSVPVAGSYSVRLSVPAGYKVNGVNPQKAIVNEFSASGRTVGVSFGLVSLE